MMNTVNELQDQTQTRKKEVRLYTKAPGTAYLLPSDEEERRRLFIQHGLIEKCFGGLVHVPLLLTDGDCVLESATGTGVWLLGLAKQVPKTVQLTGIDIEPRLFPNPSTAPPNVNFQVHSILQLPRIWTDKFAFVHQRLLIAALRTTEWPQALQEIRRVLKPGGWVQLVEVDDWVSGPVMKIFHSLMVKLGASRGITMWPDIVPWLNRFLEHSGFVDIHVTRRTSALGQWAGRAGKDGRDNMMALFRGIRAPVLEAGGFGHVKNGVVYDELLDRVASEMDSMPTGEIRWVMICARKP